MSALNAQTTNSSLDEERRAHEPSMEEILASIRRIIADDDASPSVRRDRLERGKNDDLRPEPRKTPEPKTPELRTTEPEAPTPRIAVVEQAPAAEEHLESRISDARADEEPVHDASVGEEPLFAEHDSAEELEAVGDETYSEYEHAEREYHERGRDDAFSHAENTAPLVSSDAAAAIAAQFQTLAASMVINDSGLLHDYAREMLRPMLKAWLDDNLPVLVERLVRAEIERVARGGRR